MSAAPEYGAAPEDVAIYRLLQIPRELESLDDRVARMPTPSIALALRLLLQDIEAASRDCRLAATPYDLRKGLATLRASMAGFAHIQAAVQSAGRTEQVWSYERQHVAAVRNRASTAGPPSTSVFIIHGHDHGLKETVARTVSTLGLNPVILHEPASRARTIIEKLEDHAGPAPFAIALFTPDDLGESVTKVKTQTRLWSRAQKALRFRARQNVVLELGWFMGRLRRGNTVVLVKGPIELPSDLGGVLYIPVDEAGAWRLALAKELRAAGFAFDPDRLLDL